MLTVKASAKPSDINGIGLFAEEKILKGTITWKFNPKFDLVFDVEEVEKMAEAQRAMFEKTGFISKKTGKYIYSIDDSRFCNHSSKGNNIDFFYSEDEPEGYGITNRDIEEGEELLVNYRQFDKWEETSNKTYLDS
mgnify:CR=1 FL=1